MIVRDPSKPFSRSASTVLAPPSPPPTTTMSADCSGMAALLGRRLFSPACYTQALPIHSRSRHDRAMTHEVRGVVSLAKGEPVSLQTVLVPDPGPGEALVQ